MENIELIENPCTVVVPPNVQAQITGIKLARIFPSGCVQIEHLDGNTQSAHLTNEELRFARRDFFALVKFVKDGNGPSTK